MKLRPASLALRLTAFLGIATTLVFLIFGWIIQVSIARHFAEQDADELRGVAHAIQRALPELPSGRDAGPLERELAGAVAGHHGVYYSVADLSGRQLFATPGPDLTAIAGSVASAPYIDAGSLHIWREGGKTYRGAVVRRTAATASGAGPFTLVVATAMDSHLRFLARFRNVLWVATLVACIVSIFSARLAVYQGHAPLRSISRKIRSVTSDQLHVRLIPEQVPIELAELVSSFNDMLERIEEGFRKLSNFSADIAHELRTPVTNLTTQAQVALAAARSEEQYREIIYSALEEYERMAAMIGDMLFLAQTDHGQLNLDNSDTDLAAEIRNLFDYFEAWADERGVAMVLEGDAPMVRGDSAMLRRALSNLLSNAIRYAPAGTSVTVSLVSDGRYTSLRVANSGDSISSEHLPRLFDRFYRVDPSRQRKGDGAGLGLAIVKSIVDAHRGHVSAKSAHGTTSFQIILPGLET